MRRPPSLPPELPGYDYVRLLGSGGFSDVFLYQQRLPKRQVAVKVLLTDELNPRIRQQFTDEANLMAQLSTHPAIVTIYHADVAGDGRPYFVMEYASGPSFADRYKREPLPVEEALRIGVRIAGAVATAHAAGILHRDIKPANVLTNDYGWPALTDFGISSTLEDDLPVHTGTLDPSASPETGSNNSVGLSVPWSGPEMFVDSPQPDVRSDLFSLAATLYTLLAGHTPFEIPGRPNGTLDLIARIERGTITPLNRPDAPRSLIAVLNRGMASRRDDRFDTAIDFARALQRIELELGYAPTSIEVPNLHLVAEPRPEAGDDETRVRSVATINAQRPVPAPTVDSADVFAEASVIDDGTMLRAGSRRDAQAPVSSRIEDTTVIRGGAGAGPGTERHPEPAPEPAPESPAPPARRSRGRLLLVVGIPVAVVVVLGAAIGGSVMFSPSTPTTTAKPPAAGAESAISTQTIPMAELAEGGVRVFADGTGVSFELINPDPADGDQFVWARSESPNERRVAPANTIEISELAPGSRVCVDVSIRRAGVLSPEPLTACTP